jgi:nickel superoxide dismutase
MKKLPNSVRALAALSLTSSLLAATGLAATGAAAWRPLPRHCQVPCGIYGDQMRIGMLLEDAATIEKGMKEILTLQGEEKPNYNQIVRWVSNKDQHSQSIQDQVSAYWLAQRIKAPEAAGGEEARAKYLKQLELLHGITVTAMKCKQTTDVANVAAIRKQVNDFAATYFSAEDLAHINEHHGAK